MPKGIMTVHARPASPEETSVFHHWYDEVHIPEVLALDGFTAARRLVVEGGESYLTIYEVDDVDAAKAVLAAAQSSGSMARPVGLQLSPPPTVQWLADLA